MGYNKLAGFLNGIQITLGLTVGLFGASFAGNAAETDTQKAPDSRPNIIFILTDDQRWDALGCAGNDVIHTPEMDKLAKEDVNFSHGIASTPICSASRVNIFSGLYERTHKYTFQTRDIKEEYMNRSFNSLYRSPGIGIS